MQCLLLKLQISGQTTAGNWIASTASNVDCFTVQYQVISWKGGLDAVPIKINAQKPLQLQLTVQQIPDDPRMKYTRSLIVLSFAALSLNATAADDFVFLENNGLVVMDVESMPAEDGWTEKTDIADFKGESYYEWTGSNHFNKGNAGKGAITYTFRITSPGNYQMRWRNRIAVGESNTEHNDSWMRLATGEDIIGEEPLSGWTKVYTNNRTNWTWDARTVDHVGNPLRQYFSSGDHTIEISGRSAGHAIDRIALFKYEEINYSNSKFNGYEESATTTAPYDGPDPEPQPEPDPEPEPEPALPDWSTASVTQPINTCDQGVLSLSPTDDLFSQNNIVTDNDTLKINDDNRTTLMKFDMSLVPASVDTANLIVTVDDDKGKGTLILSSGHHSDWSERDTGFNRPDNSILLGTYAGNWDQNVSQALPLDVSLLGSEYETLILEMAAGADDVSLKARSTDDGPRLQLTGGSDFCAEHTTLVELSAQEERELEEEPVETPVVDEPDPIEPVDNPDNTPDTPDSELPDLGGQLGSPSLLIVVLIVFGFRRRHQH